MKRSSSKNNTRRYGGHDEYNGYNGNHPWHKNGGNGWHHPWQGYGGYGWQHPWHGSYGGYNSGNSGAYGNCGLCCHNGVYNANCFNGGISANSAHYSGYDAAYPHYGWHHPWYGPSGY